MESFVSEVFLFLTSPCSLCLIATMSVMSAEESGGICSTSVTHRGGGQSASHLPLWRLRDMVAAASIGADDLAAVKAVAFRLSGLVERALECHPAEATCRELSRYMLILRHAVMHRIPAGELVQSIPDHLALCSTMTRTALNRIANEAAASRKSIAVALRKIRTSLASLSAGTPASSSSVSPASVPLAATKQLLRSCFMAVAGGVLPLYYFATPHGGAIEREREAGLDWNDDGLMPSWSAPVAVAPPSSNRGNFGKRGLVERQLLDAILTGEVQRKRFLRGTQSIPAAVFDAWLVEVSLLLTETTSSWSNHSLHSPEHREETRTTMMDELLYFLDNIVQPLAHLQLPPSNATPSVFSLPAPPQSAPPSCSPHKKGSAVAATADAATLLATRFPQLLRGSKSLRPQLPSDSELHGTVTGINSKATVESMAFVLSHRNAPKDDLMAKLMHHGAVRLMDAYPMKLHRTLPPPLSTTSTSGSGALISLSSNTTEATGTAAL